MRLKRFTASPIIDALQKQKEKGESLSRTEQEKLLFNVLGKRRFRDALARFIVRANVSDRVVELDEFEELCKALDPQCAQTLEVAYIYTTADTLQLRAAASRRGSSAAVFCIMHQHLYGQLDERRKPSRGVPVYLCQICQ